jgi:hypothetical protein
MHITGEQELAETLATITFTPLGIQLRIFYGREPAYQELNHEYMYDFCSRIGDSPEGREFLNMSVFTEAALVFLFLFGRRHIPSNTKGWKLYPDMQTNDALANIFRKPDEAIFGKTLTFISNVKPKREIRPHYTWYDLLFFKHGDEEKVGGLWGTRPLLFEKREFKGIQQMGSKPRVCWKPYRIECAGC